MTRQTMGALVLEGFSLTFEEFSPQISCIYNQSSSNAQSKMIFFNAWLLISFSMLVHSCYVLCFVVKQNKIEILVEWVSID